MLVIAVCAAILVNTCGMLAVLAAPVRVAEGGLGLPAVLLGMVCFSISSLVWVFVGLRLAGMH